MVLHLVRFAFSPAAGSLLVQTVQSRGAIRLDACFKVVETICQTASLTVRVDCGI